MVSHSDLADKARNLWITQNARCVPVQKMRAKRKLALFDLNKCESRLNARSVRTNIMQEAILLKENRQEST